MLQALPRLLALDLSALIVSFKTVRNQFFLLIDQNTNTHKDSNLSH